VNRIYTAAWRVRARCAGAVRAARRLLRKQEGASLVEYALLVALIAMVCIAAVALLGSTMNNVFCNIKANLTANGVS
jgi:pilus assembly protein Flp/PilA